MHQFKNIIDPWLEQVMYLGFYTVNSSKYSDFSDLLVNFEQNFSL